ncbi:MAG: multidrug efflux RND transporter permease subunit [Phycisphaerales bacterium]|nr:multidrug efflux RND transporter permease subunit [Phycisphaerales bacterium]
MTRFFISRPIFASAIAILMVVVGVVSIFTLPVSLFPPIVPPTVQVIAGYPGSSAEVVARVITTPLEQQINGVEGMIYIASNSTSNGASSITVTFEVGYDVDIAAVDIQNKVQTAIGQLPDVTQRSGVAINKAESDITCLLTLYDTTGGYDSSFLGNWAQINMVDALNRLPGAGQVTNFGLLEYSIRIWLDPDKMASIGITPNDVVNAVKSQNIDVAAGQVGAPPIPESMAFTYQLTTQGQLKEAEDFNDIVIAVRDGAVIQVKDIGRVELGAESYATSTTYQNQPTALLGIFQRSGANAIQLSNQIQGLIDEMEKKGRFPDGVKALITYDSTDFVKDSMSELVVTLLEAIGLVVIVVFVFLQSWRTTIIPIIAIPVSLVATFAVLAAFGFSINTLTLLGLVLAVGLVVDDAIVVVENVERQLEKGLGRREAAIAAMKEVTPPIVATTAVLLAVFVPTAFMPGIAGQLYNQFALTIAFSVGLSAFNSLSLSPALSGVLLRHTPREDRIKPFRIFNDSFDSISSGFSRFVGMLGRKLWWAVLIAFALLIMLTFNRFKETPGGFVPAEDQGWFFVFVALPSGSSLERTEEACAEAATILSNTPGVQYVNTVAGYNFLDTYSDSAAGVVFAILDPFADRTASSEGAFEIIKASRMNLAVIEGATCIPINPPAIPGLGSTGGFQFEILDQLDKGSDALLAATLEFIEKAESMPEIGKLLCDFKTDVPQVNLDIDRVEATRLGLSMGDVFQTLQVHLGGYYVNNWNQFNQVYQVNLQAEGADRMTFDDILQLRVANKQGDQIPLSQFVKLEQQAGPMNIPHYNLFESAQVIGGPAKGKSGGEAVIAMTKVAEEVLAPKGWGYQWTGTVYQQMKVGSIAPMIFGLSLITIFLVLAALYESWAMPFVILLSVPLAVLGALIALDIRGLPLDVYGQIGLLMLVGLAAKNAILIVEFAKTLREDGWGIVEAAMEAVRLRLRPILMTAFAFILGVVPLVIATGPGANARHSIGTTVFGGMIASTFLSLLIVPVIYIMVEFTRERIFGVRGDDLPPDAKSAKDPL